MSSGLFDKFKSGKPGAGANKGASKFGKDSAAKPTLGTRPTQATSSFGSRTTPTSTFGTRASSLGAKREMNEATFVAYRDFIYKQSGIYFTENKKYLLEGRVSKRLEAHNMTDYNEYLQFISSPLNMRKELQSLFEVITINETYFFRNEPQFHALQNVILPELIQKKQSSPIKKIRLWSAACSSGEEPYTMAMILKEHFVAKYPSIRFEVVANDISTAVLNKARAGVYNDYAVRNVPPDLKAKYFKKDGDKWIIAQELRNLVRFSHLNLYDGNALRTIGTVDVIFCCNVLIYFDQDSKKQVVQNLFDRLEKNGFLMIGYSESLHGITKAFKLVHFPKTLAYKKE